MAGPVPDLVAFRVRSVASGATAALGERRLGLGGLLGMAGVGALARSRIDLLLVWPLLLLVSVVAVVGCLRQRAA
jgi:hypothetical protein